MATFEEKLIALLNPKRFRDTTSKSGSFGYEHPFESDYFRVVTSAPVRRLQDKTQIFPLEKCDFYRRRLTHSLEVAAIGRRIGTIVEEELFNKKLLALNGKFASKYKSSFATILETAGLVHDIGNPPFGHFGEKTISSFFTKLEQVYQQKINIQRQKLVLKSGEDVVTFEMSEAMLVKESRLDSVAEAYYNLSDEQKADLAHFDGNVQGFRILRHLGLSADDNSFNLTKPALAATIKYPYSSLKGNQDENAKENKGKIITHAQKSFGFFDAEAKDYESICQDLHLRVGQRHPLVYLLEAADDISNVTSDIEDGYKMGVLSIEKIFSQIETLKIKELSYENIKQYLEKQRDNSQLKQPISDELLMKELRIRMEHLLIEETIQTFMSSNVVEDIVSASFDEGAVPTNSLIGEELLSNSKLKKELKSLQNDVYSNRSVLKSELLGKHVITELLSMFTKCMFNKTIEQELVERGASDESPIKISLKTEEGKLYALISDSYKRTADCGEDEIPFDPYKRFMLAVDYVAGMTDSYAVDLYNELINSKY